MASRKNAVVKLLNLQQLKQITNKSGRCGSGISLMSEEGLYKDIGG